ncbi:MAG: TetR family transcriptional regulator C-terminal domain-containing protein, partial [Candidatus Nanopelagicales bacterium]
AVERGFDGLRFADVANATCVPVSSLQYAFGTRDVLVREVLRAGVRSELSELQRVVGREADPLRRIDVFIRRSITVDDQARREGWLLWIEYWRAALRDNELRQEYAELGRSWRALVKTAIDDGVRSGQFFVEGPHEDVAAAIVAITDGLGLQVEVGDSRMRAARAIRASRRTVRVLLGVTE